MLTLPPHSHACNNRGCRLRGLPDGRAPLPVPGRPRHVYLAGCGPREDVDSQAHREGVCGYVCMQVGHLFLSYSPSGHDMIQIVDDARGLLREGNMDGGVLVAVQDMQSMIVRGPPSIWEEHKGAWKARVYILLFNQLSDWPTDSTTRTYTYRASHPRGRPGRRAGLHNI